MSPELANLGETQHESGARRRLKCSYCRRDKQKVEFHDSALPIGQLTFDIAVRPCRKAMARPKMRPVQKEETSLWSE